MCTWLKVAQEFVDNLDHDWPAQLCSREQAEKIGFMLDVAALAWRFQKLAKDKEKGDADRILRR